MEGIEEGIESKVSEREEDDSMGTSVNDTDRFMHIAYLLVHVGSKVLRRLLHFQTVTPTCNLDQYLANKRIDIDKLRQRKILKKSQIDILYPPRGRTNLGNYDTTLLVALFTNIVPNISQQQLSMIQSLRDNTNRIYTHAKSVTVNSNDYLTLWNDICKTLEALSKQCNDPDFENEITREIRGIQLSRVKEMTDPLAKLRKNNTAQGKLHPTILNRCRSKLIKDLNVDVVMMYIQQKGLLHDVTIRNIMEQITSSDKTLHLIEQLKQMDHAAYEQFKDCLILANDLDLKQKLDEEEENIDKMKEKHKGVPIEILKMDNTSIQLFEKALKDGKVSIYNIRIMVVGSMGVGKTTLVKRLLGEEVNISERKGTEGIDVHINCCKLSLSTHKWTRLKQDSEHDILLENLATVLYKGVSVAGNVSNEKVLKPLEEYETESLKESHAIVNDQNHSSDHASVTHQQNESDAYKPTQSATITASTILMLKEKLNTIKSTGENSLLTIWDFAGENAFYTTHQTFLTKRAIYLMVYDVSKPIPVSVDDDCYFDSKELKKGQIQNQNEDWLNSIHSCASEAEVGSPPVILIGTHVDKIEGDKHESCKRYFRSIREHLKDKPTRFHLVDDDFAIDNTGVDSKLDDLKRAIVEAASQQEYWGEQMPALLILLEQELMKRKDDGVKVMSRTDVEAIYKGVSETSEGLDMLLNFMHATGTIIYFSIAILRENILLDPTVLIDAMKTLINAKPDLPEGSADNGIAQKWSDFKGKGILSTKLIDAIWTKEKYPHLHDHQCVLLSIMEHLNIIAKPKEFCKKGEKVKDFFLVPCMLSQNCPKEVISLDPDQRMVSTPVLCFIFKGKYLPKPLFYNLIADCITHWPVAKKKDTSENLIFSGCCIFDLDLLNRLTLYCKNHIVFARITRMLVDEVKTLDAKLCTRVRRVISRSLNRITSYLSQTLQYGLSIQYPRSQDDDSEVGFSPLFDVWFAEEGNADDAPITNDQMNYLRLNVALITVCGDAMREVLSSQVPEGRNIYDLIYARKADLTDDKRRILDTYQIAVVFPDNTGAKTGTLDQFDITLLYTLIRYFHHVQPTQGYKWAQEPKDDPRDNSLWANVERIRLFRNLILHSPNGQISDTHFEDYWNKIETVIKDIEKIIKINVCIQKLEKLNKVVLSVYEVF